MDNYEDDLVEEWLSIVADDTENFKERESSSLTWDDELVQETHRKVAIRARRATTGGLYAVVDWSHGGILFRWTAA